MSGTEPTASEAERRAAITATANHIHSVVGILRELDFAETPPAFAYRAH